MSTILVTHDDYISGNEEELLKLTRNSSIEQISCDKYTIYSSRVDSLKDWGYAEDPESGIKLILGGRVALESDSWQLAEQLPYTGGLASRAILNNYLNYSANNFYSSLNGAYAVIIYVPESNFLHIISDRMGMYPLYRSLKDTNAISTHPDILTSHLQDRFEFEIDRTSIAEFLSRAETVFPYTFYEELKQMAPSTHFIMDLSESLSIQERHEYWAPKFLSGDLTYNRNKLVSELASAFQKAVHLRTHDKFEDVGVLLSGGTDSRGILFGAESTGKITSITYTESKSDKEYTIASKLSNKTSADHLHLQMNYGHYLKDWQKKIRWGAGVGAVETDHLTPFEEELRNLDLDVILSACYSDYMFKGLADNLYNKNILNYDLPMKEISEYNHSYYLTHYDISTEYESKVENRWQSRFEEAINSSSPKSNYIAEDKRLRPVSREADVMGRLILTRAFCWDHLLSDKNILDVYGKIPLKIKKDNKFFEEVIRQVVPTKAKDIKNANTGLPLGATVPDRIMKKIIMKLNSNREDSENMPVRSMDELAHLIHSSQSFFHDTWKQQSEGQEELLTEILGFNPWNEDFSHWREDKKHFAYRIVSLYLWLKYYEIAE